MAGLNNIISNTAQQTTTLPSWFDTAQQNVVSPAGQQYAAAPTPQNTVAQNAVNQLSGPTNAFTNAAGTLQSIATGAANPWLTNPTTGAVTPNTDTALGSNIASGNFGSLRGETAVNKAKADALAQLFAQQNQAALTNQATGVNAAQGVGNVTQQDINNLLTVGQYQQAAPFSNVSNYGKILGGIQAPTTVSNQTQLSPLNQVGGLIAAIGGTGSGTGILNSLGVGGLTGLFNKISETFGSSGSSGGSGSYTDTTGGIYGPTPDGGNISGDPSNVQYDDDGNLLPQ